jgi:hypothetical protein
VKIREALKFALLNYLAQTMIKHGQVSLSHNIIIVIVAKSENIASSYTRIGIVNISRTANLNTPQ